MNRLFIFVALLAVSSNVFAFGKKKPKNEDIIVVQEASPVVYVQQRPVVVIPPPPVVYSQAVVVGSAPGMVTFTNQSGYTAAAIYARPAGTCCNGPDLLGASGGVYLRNGEAREISMSGTSCYYDVVIDWAEPGVGSTVIQNADFCRLPRWTLVPPSNCCR